MHKISFAPVAPVALLHSMLRHSAKLCGPYHLLLAHDVLEHKDEFEYWRRELDKFHGGFVNIIMDSSVIELGAPVSIETILEAAEIVWAKTVVLPDIIGSAEETDTLVVEALQHPYIKKYETMYVPQGKTWEEYVMSLEKAAKYGWGTQIGLPRDAHKFVPSRAPLAHISAITNPYKKIHLLGFSNSNVADDFITSRQPGVVGIDSAVPVRAGQRGIEFRVSVSDYGQRGDYWSEISLHPQAADNIQYVRNLLTW